VVRTYGQDGRRNLEITFAQISRICRKPVTKTPNQNFELILGGRAAGPSTMLTAHNARLWEKSLGFSFWIAEAEMDKLKH